MSHRFQDNESSTFRFSEKRPVTPGERLGSHVERLDMLSKLKSAKVGVVVAMLLGGAAAIRLVELPVRAAGDNERRPVLVELFTSEGCSSCPPADALLAKLDADQVVPGARVIVLSEHVTYWDRLGWRDPFSLEAMTRRQQQYSQRFNLDDVYTPQAVVDGAAQLVGSDERGLRRDVAQAAQETKLDVKIEGAQASPDHTVQFHLRFAANASTSHLVAALAEDTVQSSVTRGENAGRTLRHVAVVRTLQDFGTGSLDGRSLALRLPEGAATNSHSLRLVVFLADAKTGRVLGADEQTIRIE